MTAQQTTSSGAESSQAVTCQGSYTSGTSDIPLLGMTIGDLFDQTVETYPDHMALISRAQRIRLSYRELQQQVNQCARGLMHLGLQKGERVGIWAPNRAEWCVTQFATSKLGLILVNINPAYRVHELEYALNQSGCSALVLAPTFKSSNYVEMLTSLAPELKDCEAGQLQSAKLPRLRTVICLGEERHPGMYSWGDVMAKGAAVRQEQLNERQREQEFDDPINIQITSELVQQISTSAS
jgi:fatty-acyl-CoA synthase